MRTSPGSRLALFTLCGLGYAFTPSADAQPRPRAAPVTRADVDRLDKKIEEQQRKLDRLIKLQIQYLQQLEAMTDGSSPPPIPEIGRAHV